MAEVKNKPNTEEAAVLTENEINEQMQVRIDKMHKLRSMAGNLSAIASCTLIVRQISLRSSMSCPKKKLK
jgi:hypothetical protein